MSITSRREVQGAAGTQRSLPSSVGPGMTLGGVAAATGRPRGRVCTWGNRSTWSLL